MRSVPEIGDELYALSPAEFTAARDAEVARARERGDRSAASAIAALKRPTQAAHLVNLLALRRPEVVADLLDLGARLRDAQARGGGALLRDLSTQRRRRLDEAVRLCSTLAAEAGSGPITQAQLGEARTTLEAAMADDTASDLVRTARVTKALVYAGFGVAGELNIRHSGVAGELNIRHSGVAGQTGIRAGPGRSASGVAPAVRPDRAEPDTDRTSRQEAQRAREEQAQRERAEARQALAHAAAELEDARTAERAADEQVAALTAQLAQIREDLDRAQAQARSARTARHSAERAYAIAARVTDRIER